MPRRRGVSCTRETMIGFEPSPNSNRATSLIVNAIKANEYRSRRCNDKIAGLGRIVGWNRCNGLRFSDSCAIKILRRARARSKSGQSLARDIFHGDSRSISHTYVKRPPRRGFSGGLPVTLRSFLLSHRRESQSVGRDQGRPVRSPINSRAFEKGPPKRASESPQKKGERRDKALFISHPRRVLARARRA